MEITSFLTEIYTFEFSYFRHFCVVGYGVCEISSSYSFQLIMFLLSIHNMDLLKICMWVNNGARINFDGS